MYEALLDLFIALIKKLHNYSKASGRFLSLAFFIF